MDSQSPDKSVKSDFSKLGFGLVLFLLVPQIVAGVVSVVLSLIESPILDTDWYMWALSYVPLYFVGFPLLLLVWSSVPNREYTPKRSHIKLNFVSIIQTAAACMAVAYLLQILSMSLAGMLSKLKGSSVDNPLEGMLAESGVWISSFVLIVVAPIMEEIVFRKLLYKKLMPYGANVFIIFSAAVFAMFHGNLFQIPYAFVLGAVFAYVTMITGTISYSIALHMIVNSIGGGIGNIVMTLGDETASMIYGSLVLFFVFVGVVVIISKFRSRQSIKDNIAAESADIIIENKRNIYLNAGVIFYGIVVLVFIVLTTLA